MESWASPGVALLALGVAIWALLYSKKQSEAGIRQAVAAEGQLEVSKRQLEVMELQAEEARSRAGASSQGEPTLIRAAPYVPPWSVSPTGKHSFLLVNGGSEPAFDVSLDFDEQPARIEQREWSQIDPRATASVMMFRAMGASPNEVTVRWRRVPDGEVLKWTTALR